MSELLPCPFCGDDNAFIEGHPFARMVTCNKCEAFSGQFDGDEAAIAAWNRRPISPAMGEETTLAAHVTETPEIEHVAGDVLSGTDHFPDAGNMVPSPEPVAWVTADILAAMKRGERAVPGWKQSADFCIALYAAPPSQREVIEGGLLAEMEKHLGWELDWGALEPNDEEGEHGWRVHDRRGNRSDREWTLLGFGQSPASAISAALRSLATGGRP